ncbi:MAG: tyrosine-type recombinase/integrase, partial [Ruthenibacterium sp.]
MKKIHFSQNFIKNVVVPTTGRAEYYDEGCSFLALRATQSQKCFYYNRKFNGTSQRIKIGDTAIIALTEARQIAQEWSVKIAKGESINTAYEDTYTVGKFFQVWLDMKKTRGDSQRCAKSSIQRFSCYVPKKLANTQLSACKSVQFETIKNTTAAQIGQRTASILITDLTAMYNYAIKLDIVKTNPLKAVQKFPCVKRERFLLESEVTRFFNALKAEEDNFRDTVLTLLFTAKRKSNILALKCVDVDLRKKIFYLSGDVTKNSKPDVSVFDDYVLQIFKRRIPQSLAIRSPFVFASKVAPQKHYSLPHKKFKAFLQRAQIANFRIHDLRRTLASWMAQQNTSLHIIADAL